MLFSIEYSLIAGARQSARAGLPALAGINVY
jgi:hypothetical protein